MVTKTVTAAQLLVTMASIPYTYTLLYYLQPLPALVCMSIQMLMFSSFVYFESCSEVKVLNDWEKFSVVHALWEEK